MLIYLYTITILMSASMHPILDYGDTERLVTYAQSLVNTKYKYGGKDRNGFDCSGFTQFVYKNVYGVNLASSSRLQIKQGKEVKLTKALPGDLIFFKRKGKVNHVGIISKITNKEIWVVHSTTSRGVIIENISTSSYWKKKIYKIKRIL